MKFRGFTAAQGLGTSTHSSSMASCRESGRFCAQRRLLQRSLNQDTMDMSSGVTESRLQVVPVPVSGDGCRFPLDPSSRAEAGLLRRRPWRRLRPRCCCPTVARRSHVLPLLAPLKPPRPPLIRPRAAVEADATPPPVAALPPTASQRPVATRILRRRTRHPRVRQRCGTVAAPARSNSSWGAPQAGPADPGRIGWGPR